MVKYFCNNCKKEFIQKNDLERHTKRKFKCESLITDDIKDDIFNSANSAKKQYNTTINQPKKVILYNDVYNPLKCKNCEKIFARSDNLKKHLNGRCKTRNNNKIIDLLLQQQEENKQMKNDIITLTTKITDLESKIKVEPSTEIAINKTNITNNTMITNNNITLKFGEENASSILSKKDIQYIVNAKIDNILPRSIEITHFNKKYPQLQNVYISDKKMQTGTIYNGSKFELKKITNIINDLITNHQDNLFDYLNMDGLDIDDKKREAIDDIIDNFHKMDDSINDNERNKYNEFVKNIKLVLYNNKDTVINTQKKITNKKLASTNLMHDNPISLLKN